MMSVLGLLACATVAGMFAAKKWPQGPPRNMPLRAWDWLAEQVAPPTRAHTEVRYEGPAPRFSPSSSEEPNTASSGLAPPEVQFAEPPLPEAEQPRGEPDRGSKRDVAPSAGGPPAPTHLASTVVGTNEPSQLNPSRYAPGKPAAFWPSDLADLLPLGAESSPAATSGPSATSQQTPGGAASETVEQLIRRLEQMGAVVMRLERQPGAAGYLFRCELPLPHNPRYHRFFQAGDAEPARAIQRVIRDVEAWKAGDRR
jgi:hypothetical protein